MTREQAINYLISSGFTLEQVGDVVRALTYEPTTKNDSSELEKNSKKLEKGATKNDLGVDCVSRQAISGYIAYILNHGMGKKKSFGFIKKFVDKLPSVTPQLSVPEVTALAEWTTKLTKASEEAYNKGYADGMKAQAEHESLCKEEREISKEKAIEILRTDNISSYSVEDILSARDMAIKALEQEPTTKNNLGVDCIKKSDAINIIQDMHGLARADVISDAVNRIITMPSVTPQEPILNKIRAEIETKYGQCDICEYFEDYDYEENDISEYRPIGNIADILQIIDKYKAESEK